MENEMLTNLMMFGGLIGGILAFAQLGTWINKNFSTVKPKTLLWMVYILSLIILFMSLFIIT